MGMLLKIAVLLSAVGWVALSSMTHAMKWHLVGYEALNYHDYEDTFEQASGANIYVTSIWRSADYQTGAWQKTEDGADLLCRYHLPTQSGNCQPLRAMTERGNSLRVESADPHLSVFVLLPSLGQAQRLYPDDTRRSVFSSLDNAHWIYLWDSQQSLRIRQGPTQREFDYLADYVWFDQASGQLLALLSQRNPIGDVVGVGLFRVDTTTGDLIRLGHFQTRWPDNIILKNAALSPDLSQVALVTTLRDTTPEQELWLLNISTEQLTKQGDLPIRYLYQRLAWADNTTVLAMDGYAWSNVGDLVPATNINIQSGDIYQPPLPANTSLIGGQISHDARFYFFVTVVEGAVTDDIAPYTVWVIELPLSPDAIILPITTISRDGYCSFGPMQIDIAQDHDIQTYTLDLGPPCG